MMTSNAISAKGIKAQLHHPILTRVFDKPTHKQVKMVIHELSANLMAIFCPLRHSKGHLGLLQDLAIYLACNGEAFNIPNIEPPAYPVIPAGATTAKRKELHATNPAARKAWNTCKMVLTITHDQFEAAIDNVYYTVLDNPTKGLNTIDLCSLVMRTLTIYAWANLIWMTKQPSSILVYTRKQEKCQVFATDAGVPLSNETMITTGTKHALVYGNMMLAWCEWKPHPLPNHTWPNWKAHWTVIFAKMHNINRMTAGDTVFGANQGAELKQAQQMASSLDNLANTTIQKNTTIKNLVATNSMLTKAIANIQLSQLNSPLYECSPPASQPLPH
jgi:hypothetical protein